jgi:hypothetical protein
MTENGRRACRLQAGLFNTSVNHEDTDRESACTYQEMCDDPTVPLDTRLLVASEPLARTCVHFHFQVAMAVVDKMTVVTWISAKYGG